MEDRFNPFGLLVVLAFAGACFEAAQEALDRHGLALYWPSFAPDNIDAAKSSYVNRNLLSVPTPPEYRPGSALPPPPPPPPQAIAQGGPAAPAAAPAAAPPSPAQTIDRARLEALLSAAGGMTADGCLKQPVIVDGMQGVSRVEATPTWQPGATLILSIDPANGAVQCVEFAFDRSSPQW